MALGGALLCFAHEDHGDAQTLERLKMSTHETIIACFLLLSSWICLGSSTCCSVSFFPRSCGTGNDEGMNMIGSDQHDSCARIAASWRLLSRCLYKLGYGHSTGYVLDNCSIRPRGIVGINGPRGSGADVPARVRFLRSFRSIIVGSSRGVI